MYIVLSDVDLFKNIPSFKDLVSNYGPWLGMILFLVFLLMICQGWWYNKILKSKDEEIKRSIAREEELHKRMYKLLDVNISGVKKAKTK